MRIRGKFAAEDQSAPLLSVYSPRISRRSSRCYRERLLLQQIGRRPQVFWIRTNLQVRIVKKTDALPTSLNVVPEFVDVGRLRKTPGHADDCYVLDCVVIIHWQLQSVVRLNVPASMLRVAERLCLLHCQPGDLHPQCRRRPAPTLPLWGNQAGSEAKYPFESVSRFLHEPEQRPVDVPPRSTNLSVRPIFVEQQHRAPDFDKYLLDASSRFYKRYFQLVATANCRMYCIE